MSNWMWSDAPPEAAGLRQGTTSPALAAQLQAQQQAQQQMLQSQLLQQQRQQVTLAFVLPKDPQRDV